MNGPHLVEDDDTGAVRAPLVTGVQHIPSLLPEKLVNAISLSVDNLPWRQWFFVFSVGGVFVFECCVVLYKPMRLVGRKPRRGILFFRETWRDGS